MKVNKLKLDAFVFGRVGYNAACPCCDYSGCGWSIAPQHTQSGVCYGYVCPKCKVIVKISSYYRDVSTFMERHFAIVELLPPRQILDVKPSPMLSSP